MRILRAVLFIIALTAPVHAESLNWQPWSPKPFAEAKEQKKLILLDLGAV